MKQGFLPLLCYFITHASFAQEVNHTVCTNCWNPDSLGNHRAVIDFTGADNIAKVMIPWRRKDQDPQNKGFIIHNAKNQKVNNLKAISITREQGEIYFEPISGKGTYYVYYMPYRNAGRPNYPQSAYLKPDVSPSPQWLQLIGSSNTIEAAAVMEIQSIDSLNSFYPMEVIATSLETKNLLEVHSGEPYLIFPEDRLHPIKMTDDLPLRWIKKGTSNNFSGEAAKGEWFAFQLGILAVAKLEEVHVEFSDLKSADGHLISAAAFLV